MNRSRLTVVRSAVPVGVAAFAALALAGCGGSSSNGGASGQSPAGGSSPTATHSSASTGPGSVTTDSYFPLAAGETWVYKDTLGTAGGTTINKMTAVIPTSAGQQATMTSTVSYPVKKTTKETLIFRPDGSIAIPLTQLGASVKIVSGSVAWPSAADLASGQAHTSTIVMKIAEAGVDKTITMPVTVKGEGTVSVTVPAGTYQATLINEGMTTSVDGYKITMAVRTWVANGVGPVKSEVFSSALGGSSSTPLSTEVLESFTKG